MSYQQQLDSVKQAIHLLAAKQPKRPEFDVNKSTKEVGEEFLAYSQEYTAFHINNGKLIQQLDNAKEVLSKLVVVDQIDEIIKRLS